MPAQPGLHQGLADPLLTLTLLNAPASVGYELV